MKKLRSINWYYLVGTLPFVAAITCMTVMLVHRGWLKIAAGAAGAGLLLWIIRKFRYLPRLSLIPILLMQERSVCTWLWEEYKLGT